MTGEMMETLFSHRFERTLRDFRKFPQLPALLLAAGVFGVVVVSLRPNLFVIAYIFVSIVVLILFPALSRVRRSLNSGLATLSDLKEIAEGLEQKDLLYQDKRGRLHTFLHQLAQTDMNPTSLAAAAEELFLEASNTVRELGFLRSGCVLAGLFGTVSFFAWEMLTVGGGYSDLTALLPGLRGAMVATLSGILGSLLLGYYASSLSQRSEAAITQVQAFLTGPWLTRQRITRAHEEAGGWEGIRNELARLHETIRFSVQTMAGDAHAFSLALAEVSRRLATAPPLQVPEDLKDIKTTVAEFRETVRDLGQILNPFFHLLGQINLMIPTQVVEKIRSLHDSHSELHEQIRDLSQDLRQVPERSAEAVSWRIHQAVDDVKNRLESQSSVLTDLQVASQNVHETTNAVQVALARLQNDASQWYTSLQNDVRYNRDALEAISHRVGHAAEKISASETRIAEAQQAVVACGEALQQSTTTLGNFSANYLRHLQEEIGTARDLLAEAQDVFRAAGAEFRNVARDLSAHQGFLSQFFHRLSEWQGALGQIADIHRWFSRPLVRLFARPIWGYRR